MLTKSGSYIFLNKNITFYYIFFYKSKLIMLENISNKYLNINAVIFNSSIH